MLISDLLSSSRRAISMLFGADAYQSSARGYTKAFFVFDK
jgi:hypothetical protein